jgi:hypothetical protein
MNFIKKAWLTFRQLKTWLQIVIVIVAISLFGAIGGSGSTSTDSGTTTASSSPSSEATPEASASATPEASASATPAVSAAQLKSAMSHIRVSSDTVKNTKYYTDSSSPRYTNQNGFYIYAGGSKGSTPSLFWDIQYEGSDWLFIKSYFFNIDGFTYELTPDYGVIKTDNDTNVWEWYNEAITSEQVDLIQRIINSKSAVMRLNGTQYYKDVKITATQKAALQHVLTVFQGLGGDLTNP